MGANSSTSRASGESSAVDGRSAAAGPATADAVPRETLGPDGGHLVSVTGVYLEHSWNAAAVAALISARSMAPFYRGLQDEPPVNISVEALHALLDAVGTPAPGDDEQRSVALSKLPDRKLEPQRHRQAEVLAYQQREIVECPVWYYPAPLNTSRCCDQELCTECFVQIKRAEPTPTHLVVRPLSSCTGLTLCESEPVSCLYCQEPDFGITYRPPAPAQQRTPTGARQFSAADSERPSIERSASSASGSGIALPATPAAAGQMPGPRRKSVPASASSVVSVDKVHPDWQAQLEAVRATAARRAARRIVFARAGDRLVPIGVTSPHHIAAAAHAAQLGTTPGDADGGSTLGRRSGRRRPTDGAQYLHSLGMTGTDLEELMIAEAMRLSLADEEDRQRKEQTSKKAAAAAAAAATTSGRPGLRADAGPSSGPASTGSLPPSLPLPRVGAPFTAPTAAAPTTSLAFAASPPSASGTLASRTGGQLGSQSSLSASTQPRTRDSSLSLGYAPLSSSEETDSASAASVSAVSSSSPSPR